MRPLLLLAPCVLPLAAAAQAPASAPLPGDLAPAPLAGQQQEPYLASGGGEHLLVWLDRRGALTPTVELDPWEVVQADVYAQRLDASGNPIGDPIRVDGSAYSQEAPRAAWNGTDWLVVYEDRSLSSTGFFATQDVRATRLSAAGQVLDTVALAIDVEDTETYVPCVTSDGTDWAVFWTDAFTTWGRKVFADGTLGPAKVVYGPASWHFDPEVAFAGDRYLLTWEGSGIRGRLLDTNLDPHPVKPEVFQIGNYSDAQIATDGTDFFVGYSNLGQWAELFGTVVRSNGTVVSPSGQQLDGGTFLALESPVVAWDGSGYVAAWSEYRYDFAAGGPEESLLVNRFDANGAPVWSGPVTLESSLAFSVRHPQVTSLGGGQSLVGWMDDRFGKANDYTGQARLVDATGALLTPATCTMLGPPAQLHPDLAPGPQGATLDQDVNLLVFLSADAAETRVVFQRIDGHGQVLDPEPVVVAGGSFTYTDPVAAWNGSVWLVVWEDTTGGAFNGGALAARVLPDGTVLDTTPIEVVEGNDPDVAALDVVDGDFLVAATQETSNDIRTLYGQRVGSDGTLVGGKTFLGVNYALSPSIAGFDDRWVVMWHRKPSHDDPKDYLAARLVFADGTTGAQLDPSNSTIDETLVDVAVDGNLATFVWSDGTDVRMRTMSKAGEFLGGPAGVVVNAANDEQTAPTIAFDGSKAVIAWVDDRIHTFLEPGMGDLYATRLDGASAILEPSGLALAADPDAPEGEAALVGRQGVMNVAWPAMLPEFGTWRVSIATWRDWDPLGSELAGSLGAPILEPRGLLTAGSTPTFELSNAAPGAAGFLVFGTGALNLPLYGGVLVPWPEALVPVTADVAGTASFSSTVTGALAPGTQLLVHAWLLEPSGPQGAVASEAFVATAP